MPRLKGKERIIWKQSMDVSGASGNTESAHNALVIHKTRHDCCETTKKKEREREKENTRPCAKVSRPIHPPFMYQDLPSLRKAMMCRRLKTECSQWAAGRTLVLRSWLSSLAVRGLGSGSEMSTVSSACAFACSWVSSRFASCFCASWLSSG